MYFQATFNGIFLKCQPYGNPLGLRLWDFIHKQSRLQCSPCELFSPLDSEGEFTQPWANFFCPFLYLRLGRLRNCPIFSRFASPNGAGSVVVFTSTPSNVLGGLFTVTKKTTVSSNIIGSNVVVKLIPHDQWTFHNFVFDNRRDVGAVTVVVCIPKI